MSFLDDKQTRLKKEMGQTLSIVEEKIDDENSKSMFFFFFGLIRNDFVARRKTLKKNFLNLNDDRCLLVCFVSFVQNTTTQRL